jgi:hypothetical protein
MSENRPRSIVSSKGGVLKDITQRIKLIIRLIGDSRVNPLLKIIPIGAVVYLVFPDIAPGPIDDAAILWLGTTLFVELCPPDVVAEHMEKLRLESSTGTNQAPEEGDVVEGEYRER